MLEFGRALSVERLLLRIENHSSNPIVDKFYLTINCIEKFKEVVDGPFLKFD